MTDLYCDIDGNSKKINKTISEKRDSFNKVCEQIFILSKKKFNIICFGDKVFNDILKVLLIKGSSFKINKNIRYLNSDYVYKKNKVKINVFRAMHYSYRYKDDKYLIDTLSKQLLFLNSYIK